MSNLGGTEELRYPPGGSSDLLNYLVGGRRPFEWPGVSVPVGSKLLNRVIDSFNRREGSAPDELPGNDAIPER